jgi:hypothetical protein
MGNEMKPGERTAKVVHPGTVLHYQLDNIGGAHWEHHTAVGMPYEDGGEFWVEARDDAGDIYPMPLHNATLGI